MIRLSCAAGYLDLDMLSFASRRLYFISWTIRETAPTQRPTTQNSVSMPVIHVERPLPPQNSSHGFKRCLCKLPSCTLPSTNSITLKGRFGSSHASDRRWLESFASRVTYVLFLTLSQLFRFASIKRLNTSASISIQFDALFLVTSPAP
jgi:hypothetical protein